MSPSAGATGCANWWSPSASKARGRFMDDIANGVWLMCEETYWGVPAHIGIQKRGAGLPDVTEPTIDLFAAETAELLAWTSYLLGAESRQGTTARAGADRRRGRAAHSGALPQAGRLLVDGPRRRPTREQLESVDQLELPRLRAAARARPGAAGGVRSQGTHEPRPFPRRLPSRRRLRRRPGILVPRGRIAVRQSRTALFGERRRDRLLRDAAGRRRSDATSIAPTSTTAGSSTSPTLRRRRTFPGELVYRYGKRIGDERCGYSAPGPPRARA